ncbi:MAG TPA: GNAT family N-acetyltransferase [Pyrinomonadaceae bacterium]|nr:GNAT family N-acetyltransferase [Pyrinomonadaceae bacterium]
MSENIRLVLQLTDEERRRLFGWGENIFGVEDKKYTWRPKDLHFIMDVEGQAASHVGLVDHTVNVAGQPMRIAGVGGVVTAGEMHGRGYAQKTLRYAERYMCEEMKVEFGLLFCLDRLMPFYARQGWQLLQETVEFDQPSGKMVSPLNVMVLPCKGERWPAGAVDLRSLPW